MRTASRGLNFIFPLLLGLFVLLGSKIIANILYNHGIYAIWVNMNKILYNKMAIDIC